MNIKRVSLTLVLCILCVVAVFSAEPWKIVTDVVEKDSISCYVEKGLLTSVKGYKNLQTSSNGVEDCQVIQTSSAGQLGELLGDHLLTVDSLVVQGLIDSSDFDVMWQASFYGKLEVINLENANIKEECVPDQAFWHAEEQLEPGGEYIDCIYLRRIILPDNIKGIGENAFSYAINLECINIPSSLRNIGEAAFSDCISLKADSLVFPEGIETISGYLFLNCKELKGAIVLPSTIKK